MEFHTHTNTHIKRYNPDSIKVTAMSISDVVHLPSLGTAYFRPHFACDQFSVIDFVRW